MRRSHRQQIKSKINSTRTTNFQSDFVFLLCSFLMYKTQRFSLAFHLVDLFGIRWLFLHADLPFHLSTWRLVLRLFHSFDLTKSTSARRLRWWWWCWSGCGSGRTRSYCSHWFMHSTRYTIHEYIGTHEMLKIVQVICSICVVSVHSQEDRINHMAHIERGTWTGCRDPIRTWTNWNLGWLFLSSVATCTRLPLDCDHLICSSFEIFDFEFTACIWIARIWLLLLVSANPIYSPVFF